MAEERKEELLEDICSQLSDNSYRVTRQRRVIIGLLLDVQGQHLGAEEVYELVRKDHPDIGVATVYRTLDVLAGLGIVKRLDFGDGRSVYELSDDPHHHHHLVCLACGTITEFGPDLLESLEREIGLKEKFQVTDHHVKFFGVCSRCQPDERHGG